MSGDPVLVLGANGQLGSAFTRLLENAVPVTRDTLDLATAPVDEMRQLFLDIRPGAVINCAAYTRDDAAESDEEGATEVNGRAVGRLSEAAADCGVPLVTYSTDYVFDGSGDSPYVESDPPNPLNAYGRSKLLGEELALQHDGQTLIIRTSWVVSGTHKNFVSAILGRVRAGEAVRVVNDQWGCPTIVDDLATATLSALGADARGILHLTNSGPTTWFEFAQAIVRLAGFDPSLVRPCSTDEYPTIARRPAYSVLGSERMSDLQIPPLPHWERSLSRVVEGHTSG